jgi:hypothetical protein
VNGKMIKDMVAEYIIGQMAKNKKVNGKMTYFNLYYSNQGRKPPSKKAYKQIIFKTLISILTTKNLQK